jgi:hypothetical protein
VFEAQQIEFRTKEKNIPEDEPTSLRRNSFVEAQEHEKASSFNRLRGNALDRNSRKCRGGHQNRSPCAGQRRGRGAGAIAKTRVDSWVL